MLSPAALVEWGTFSDATVDVAVASVRREAGWHIAPRLTETITVSCRGGRELLLPTRAFREAPVVVSAVRRAGVVLGGWESLSGGLWRRWGWPEGLLAVDLQHGFDTCPADLLPVLAQRAGAALRPRDPQTSSFSNGSVQMSFRDGPQHEPAVAGYAVIGGVA